MPTVGKMRAQHIKGETKKYLQGGASDPTGDLKRQASAATQQAVGQATGAMQQQLSRAAMAQTGGSPVAPGGMVAGAQALGADMTEAAAKGTSEANKLAAAVREKRKAQALGNAEKLSAERWQKGMDVANTTLKAVEVGAEATKTIASLPGM